MKIFLLFLVLVTAGCAGYRDNTSYDDPYLHTPIDNDIYN